MPEESKVDVDVLPWCMVVAADPAPLRRAAVSLLLAEKKTLAWYPDHAVGYFADVVLRLNTWSREHMAAAQEVACEKTLAQALTALVQKEADTITQGLVAMPSRPGAAPGEGPVGGA